MHDSFNLDRQCREEFYLESEQALASETERERKASASVFIAKIVRSGGKLKIEERE